MRTRTLVVSALLFLVLPAFLCAAQARDLTFEERVKAQEAIERVNYSFQLGTTRSFEAAVPRGVLEAKVRTYLKQSAALEKVWHTRITAQMLEREMQRMLSGSRMPERLRQLFAALGNDTFLVQECLVRPALAARLVENFYSGDTELHAAERDAAETLRAGLASGRVNAKAPAPNRTVVEMLREGSQEAKAAPRSAIVLPAAEFAKALVRLPKKIGGVGHVVELPDALVVQVLLAESGGKVRTAVYSVRKRSREDWWREIEGGLDLATVRAVALDAGAIPAAAAPKTPAASPWVPDAQCQDDAWVNENLGNDPPLPRIDPSYVWTGTELIVWGGSYSSIAVFREGRRYNPATDSWALMNIQDAPQGRTLHTAVWTGSTMIVWGGQAYDVDTFETVRLNSGASYDPLSDTWTSISSESGLAPRSRHTAVWDPARGRMLVWGGMTGSLEAPVFDGEGAAYDTASNTWSPMSTDLAPSARAFHSAVVIGRTMVVWGGNDGTTDLNTGGRYDLDTGVWSATSTPEAPQARRGHTAVDASGRMIVWGGRHGTDPTAALATGGQYDPATDTWESTGTVNAPAARYLHSAVSTGAKMIVWGGFDGTAFRRSGGVYDPATKTWVPTILAGAPAGRTDHAAVWTGSLMVVWGGTDDPGGGEALNSGGRYDPVQDSWTPTAVGPRPRFKHTAVWTGALVIVWGGNDYFRNLETGAWYDPALDTWTSLTVTGAPSERRLHTAVWSGDYMVVWGGWGRDPASSERVEGPLRDGRRYDPLAEGWLTVATNPASGTPAPQGRWGHTATWMTWQEPQGAGTVTKSRMLVWGGLGLIPPNNALKALPISLCSADTSLSCSVNADCVVDSTNKGPCFTFGAGARYDPETDRWEGVASAGAPARRFEHAAVAAGSKAIVWGGDDGSGGEAGFGTPLDSGGVYDPATNSWTAVASTGGPSARSRHTAVWDGTRMLVFGGTADGVSALGDGSGYDPTGAGAWTAIPATSAPSPRFWHTAVWTGREMLVWGGHNGAADLNTGARLSTVSNPWTWSPMPTDAAPLARSRHAAVWAGSFMFVWGGVLRAGEVDPIFPTFLGSGGRYFIDQTVDSDGDGYTPCQDDCNDGNPNIHPGAAEICNSIDDNCDGRTDEGITVPRWYKDVDADGSGSGTDFLDACKQPVPYRVCGISYLVQCQSDFECWTKCEVDADCGAGRTCQDDRFCSNRESCTRSIGYVSTDGDCNDLDPAIYPGHAEICNSMDDNCNGQADEGLPTGTFYPDRDTDGYGNQAAVVHGCQPLSFNVCSKTLALSCRSNLDCPTGETCSKLANYIVTGGDCDDLNSSVHPGVAEACNGIDDDCDGSIDEGIPILTGYQDADGDGFGNASVSIATCLPRSGWVDNTCDCNDQSEDIRPGATETCNGIDDNCNGATDDGTITCGVGGCERTVPLCVGGVTQTCTPGSPATDVCNGADDNCDGIVDGWKVCSVSTSIPCTTSADCPGSQTCTREGGYFPWLFPDPDGDGIGNMLDASCGEPPAGDAKRSCSGSVEAGYALVAGDNCPCLSNANQADRDGDGVGDLCDNCPDVINANQANYNGNQWGNACESAIQTADTDLSGRVDGLDLSRLGRAWATLRVNRTCQPPFQVDNPTFDRTVDFNQDGRIDGDDLAYLARYFGQSVASSQSTRR